MIEILLLSIIQGITEFIPVSSSSHLIIFSKYLDYESQSLIVDVSLHWILFSGYYFFLQRDYKFCN